MKPNRVPSYRRPLMVVQACALLLAVSSTWAQQAPATSTAAEPATPTAAAATTAATPASQEVVKLSPFVVNTTKDAGYFAENTLAGSRINTNLGDLAASITVVTKQQMEDTASVDINDIFKYEASTEGSSTYAPSIIDRGTVKDALAGYSFGNTGGTTTNAQSNRIRGLNAPDAAINNYATNNRIPLDEYNIQSVEISRGPNSLLFGLGTPSGIVNTNYAQATLNRDTTTVTVRTDQNGSYRSAITLNRSLIPDKLAVFAAALYDNRQFERKPSRDLYRRQYGAITFKPFKNTTIRAMAENYRNDANRPNFFTPRDGITPWLQAGRPQYDPVTRRVTIPGSINVPAGVVLGSLSTITPFLPSGNGQILGPYVVYTLSAGYVSTVNRILGPNAITALTSPLFVPGIAADNAHTNPSRMIDNGATVAYFNRTANSFYAPVWTSPATTAPSANSLGWLAGNPRYDIADRVWTQSTFWPAPTPVINGSQTTMVGSTLKLNTYGTWQIPGVTNKSIYDWTEYNTLQTNWAKITAANYNVEFEQQITPSLYFTAGWFRQDIDEVDNYTLNQLQGATLYIDTNVNYLDGTKNPYFGLPWIFEGQGGGIDTFYNPQTDDNYRAMLVYDLDLTMHHNWTKWLGHHRFIGTWQEQDSISAIERWRLNYVGGDQDGSLRFIRNPMLFNQATWSNTALVRHFYMASPGDAQAAVTHSTGFYGNQGWNGPVTGTIQVWNYNNNTFQNDNVIEQAVFSDAGSYRTQREVTGSQFAMQNYLWDNRLITTFGWRHDDFRARQTTSGALTFQGKQVAPALQPDQLYVNGFTGLINHDLVMSRWNPWQKYAGSTKTLGGTLRPLQNWDWVRRLGGEGSLVSQFLDGLTFYYNQSDNFNPPSAYQTDYFFNPLPKPTGKEKDYGIGFSLFNNKLVGRVTWYETKNLNERTSAASTLLTRLAYQDTTTGLAWASAVERIRLAMAAGKNLNGLSDPNSMFQNTQWNSNTVWDISSVDEQRKVYDLIKLPYLYYSGLSLGATQQSKSKGTEVQITYNPSPEWTMKLTGSKDEATYNDVAPQYDDWLAVRLPVWTSLSVSDIPDFIDPNNGRHWSLKNFWTGYGFTNVALAENTDGNTSPQNYYNNVVVSQVATAKALEGAVTPDQRVYHAAFITNYNFARGRFRGFSVGGAERWESRAAIGYYGKVGDPTQPNVINVADITRPVWGDSGNYYTDLWIAYTTKILSGKVVMSVRLNCNNAFESGRLYATQANMDGSPWAFRIIDPRQWILTAKFSF